MNVPLSSSTASSLLSLSHHAQPARRILPCSSYTQPERKTPGGRGFTDHNNLHFIAPSEQNKMSLPCTTALQRAALKSKTMGEKTHSPRPFLPYLNEAANELLAKPLLELQPGGRGRRGLGGTPWAVQREQLFFQREKHSTVNCLLCRSV